MLSSIRMSSFISPKESGKLIANIAKHVSIKQDGVKKLAEQVLRSFTLLFLLLISIPCGLWIDSRRN